jgi:hypothetical protein
MRILVLCECVTEDVFPVDIAPPGSAIAMLGTPLKRAVVYACCTATTNAALV